MTDRAALSTRNPMVRSLYAYWDSRRTGRRMPRRADIDPVDFPRHLPSVLLVDVQDDPGGRRFVYRVVGTAEVEVRGRDPTGKDVATHFFGPSREDVLGCYTQVCERCAPLLDSTPWQTSDGRVVQGEVLFLPLSEDGATVSQILVYSVTRRVLPPA